MEYPQRTKQINMSTKDFLNNEVSVINHEGVISIGQKRILDMNFEKVIISASDAMEKLAIIIENDSAVIGHIKAFVKSGDATGRLSLTNRKTDVVLKGGSYEDKCGIDFNMILLNVDEARAKEYLKEFFNFIKTSK